MTREVLVSIKGTQLFDPETGEGEVEVVTGGSYFYKEGTHYICYEEVAEGMDGVTRNLIKVDGGRVEVTKRGLTNAHMVFQKEKKNVTCYETPFGNLMVGIAATDIDIKDSESGLDVRVSYALDINEQYLADYVTDIQVSYDAVFGMEEQGELR